MTNLSALFCCFQNEYKKKSWILCRNFIGIYEINRTLHSHLGIRISSYRIPERPCIISSLFTREERGYDRKYLCVGMLLVACVASVSVRFRRNERGTRFKDREKSGASKRAGRGWGRKEGNACRQTPGFWKPPTWSVTPEFTNRHLMLSSAVIIDQ